MSHYINSHITGHITLIPVGSETEEQGQYEGWKVTTRKGAAALPCRLVAGDDHVGDGAGMIRRCQVVVDGWTYYLHIPHSSSHPIRYAGSHLVHSIRQPGGISWQPV